jgi:hypothetical protein
MVRSPCSLDKDVSARRDILQTIPREAIMLKLSPTMGF